MPTITQPEQEHIERLASAFAEPTMEEKAEKWFERVTERANKEKAEEKKSSRIREMKLAGRSEEERKFIEGTAQKDEPEKESGSEKAGRESDAAKESHGENWAERHAAHREQDARSEPQQAANHRPKDQMLADLVAGRNPIFQNSLNAALASVPNPEAVLRYLDANPHLRESLRNAKDSNELLSYVGQASARESMSEMLREAAAKHPDAAGKIRTATADIMSKAPQFVQHMVNDSEVIGELLYTLADQKTLNNLLNTARTNPGKAIRVLRDMEVDIQRALSAEKAPAARPRAPKPPSEVGGRGAATDDGTRGESDFRNFSARQARRYAGHTR